MPSVILDWLRLIRAAGLATVLSNLTAVALVAFFASDGDRLRWMAARLGHQPAQVGWVVLCSLLLYVTGMVWNDIIDMDRDRGTRPDRPLAAGRLGIAPAYAVGVIAPVGAMFAAMHVEFGVPLAGAVLSLILLYDLGLKDIPVLGSVAMAAVRSAHACFALLLLGPDHVRMLLTPGTGERVTAAFTYPAILAVYILGLTLVSELEDRRRKGSRVVYLVGGVLMLLALFAGIAGMIGSEWVGRRWHGGGGGRALVLCAGMVVVSATALWAWQVGRAYVSALFSCRCRDVGAVVGAALGGIILLDAVVATAAHPFGGLFCLALFPVFVGLARVARMD